MSTYEELLEVIKEFCNSKDEEIKRLKSRIGGLEKQYTLIRKAFLEGRYESLKWYFDG